MSSKLTICVFVVGGFVQALSLGQDKSNSTAEDGIPTVEEAREKFRKAGVFIRPFSKQADINIDRGFKGTAETFAYARAFRDGIRLGIAIDRDIEFFKLIPELNIQKLVLTSDSLSKKLSDDEIRSRLSEVAKCKDLTDFGIFGKGFPVEELKFVASFPKLQVLRLPESTNDEALKVVSQLKHLKRLEVVNCKNVVGHGFEVLGELEHLKSLDLFTCSCKDKSLSTVSELKNITHLSLPQGSTDETLQNVSRMKQLEYLQIDNTLVTDHGVKHLVKLENLDYLVLGDASVTKDSIKSLNAIPKLTNLYIRGTFITPEESKKLRIHYRHSKFEFKPKDETEKQLVLDLVKAGFVVRMDPTETGVYRVSITQQRLKMGAHFFAKLADLQLQSLSVDYDLSKQHARELCKIRDVTNIFLFGKHLKNEVAEIFHEKFKYVVDTRNGKTRITNNWKKR